MEECAQSLPTNGETTGGQVLRPPTAQEGLGRKTTTHGDGRYVAP